MNTSEEDDNQALSNFLVDVSVMPTNESYVQKTVLTLLPKVKLPTVKVRQSESQFS